MKTLIRSTIPILFAATACVAPLAAQSQDDVAAINRLIPPARGYAFPDHWSPPDDGPPPPDSLAMRRFVALVEDWSPAVRRHSRPDAAHPNRAG